MLKTIDGPKYLKLTRKLATEFANMTRCPDDREIQDARTQMLKKAVHAGRFRAPDWASAVCLETGIEYRVNGKHTSTMFSSWDGELPKLMVSVTQFECQTLKEVAELYATYDAKFSTRNSSDIYVVYARSVPELANVHKSTIRLAAAGMGYARWERTTCTGHSSNEDRANLLINNPDFVLWLEALQTKLKDNLFLHRGPVVAAMFKTWERDQEECDAFWNEVKTGSNTDTKSPSRVLQRWLLGVILSRKGNKDIEQTHDHEMLVKCIHAFNAWKRGESTKLKYYAAVGTPEVA